MWVAQSVNVRLLILAQVMISQFVSLSPTLGSLLSAQSPLLILCLLVCLSLLRSHVCTRELSRSLSKINDIKKNNL